MYRNHARGRASSKELILFKANVLDYALSLSEETREDLRQIEEGPVSLFLQFNLNHDMMYTKDGRVKRMDVSNLIKSAEDAIMDLIGLDDKFVFKVTCEKVALPKSVKHPDKGYISCHVHQYEPISL